MPDPVMFIATILGAIIALVVVISAVVITIVALLIYYYKHKKFTVEHISKILEDPDKFTKHFATEKEKTDFINKVLKIYTKRIGVDGEETVDVFTEFVLASAVEGLKSDDNKYKEEFIKEVKRHVQDLNTKYSVDDKKNKEEESTSPPDQVGEATKDEELSRHHAGRDVSHVAVIEMSPEGARKSKAIGTSRITTGSSNSTAV